MNLDRKESIIDEKLHLQESLLLELFKEDASVCIFDIGACEGESSVRYSRIFPNSKIFTFEPIPANFKLIKENIAYFQIENQITAIQICLSDKDGMAEFHVSSGTPEEFKEKNVDWEFGNKSSSLLQPGKTLETYNWLEFKDKIEVSTIRLDRFISEHSIKQIDFVHMDVQGAELMVLNGAGDSFSKIKNIWLEVEAVPLYQGQPVKKDIEKYFKSRGYIKLIDTVNNVDGDQFWSHKDWIIAQLGHSWVENKTKEIERIEKAREIPLLQKLRNKLQIRTRLAKLFK
jgi:FkbM family methyltransferase